MLDGGPALQSDVAMATNFGTQFAIVGFVGYNFGCMIASDMLFDSRGGFCRYPAPIGRCHGNQFWLYMRCTLAPPEEYD